MKQAQRRVIFFGIVGVLIVVGAILQARADGGHAANSSQTASSMRQSAQSKIPGEAPFQSLTCMIALLEFQLPLAERSCGSAIDLQPNDPIGYKYRGFTYLLEHRFERAESDFHDAVRLDPKDPDNQAGLGQSLSGQGRFLEAIQKFGIALAMSPHDVRFLSARCWARAAQGKDFAGALEDCNLALKLVPRYAVAFDGRALAYLRAGQYGASLRDYSASLKSQPNRATALFGRGVAEIRLDRKAAAHKDLAAARQLDPEIDDTYIMVGVLEPGCRDGLSPCSLPQEFRNAPQAASKYLSVSFRSSGAMHP